MRDLYARTVLRLIGPALRLRDERKPAPMFSAMRAAATAVSITTLADAVARSAGFEPPVEPDAVPVESPRAPQAPSGGAAIARPIALTELEDGRVIVDVGDEQLALTPDEFSGLCAQALRLTHQG